MLFARRLCRTLLSTRIYTWRGWLLPLCMASFAVTDVFAARITDWRGGSSTYEVVAAACLVGVGSFLLQVSESAEANCAPSSPGSAVHVYANITRFLSNLSFVVLGSHLLIYDLVERLLD